MTGDGSDPYGRLRQAEIYLAGRAGATPDVPVSVADLRAAAREALDDDAWAYSSVCNSFRTWFPICGCSAVGSTS